MRIVHKIGHHALLAAGVHQFDVNLVEILRRQRIGQVDQSAQILILRIGASPLLALALVAAHGAAIACAVVYLPGWWIRGAAAGAIGASLALHLFRDALQRSGEAVIGFTLKDDARCELALRNGETVTGTLEGSTFVTPLLTVINVRPSGKGRRRDLPTV